VNTKMENCAANEDFSLLGGPLHRLGCRLGLVHGGNNTVALGLVLGAFPWLVLVVLALLEGFGPVLFSIQAIGSHVRLLVAVPLLFACETFIDPRFAAFARGIVRSQVVPATERPALESAEARIARWRDAWLPEACLLLLAVLLGLATRNQNFFAYFSGLTGESNPSAVGRTSWASQWYWVGCMTLFRFLLLRWLGRLALWCSFLWRVSKLELRLVPTHPDRVGGLGYLELVHSEFAPLILATSAVQSASLAQDIASGRIMFGAIYPGVIFILIVDAVLFLGPLHIFSRKLWQCKVKGLSDYGAFAERYVNEFDRKWLGPDAAPRENLLGTGDIQSLADLSNSVGVVRDMRLVPVSSILLKSLAGAALLPLLPLVLFRYPLADLLAKFLGRFSGL
jgi:hypothetical protein